MRRCYDKVEGLTPAQSFIQKFAAAKESVVFDEALHLELTPPETVKTLQFEDVAFPYSLDAPPTSFAYSAPFRLLSAAGVSACRRVLHREADLITQSQRSLSQGGLVYRSAFVRDLLYSPAVCALFSQLANVPLWPNDLHQRSCTANYGKMGSGVEVDRWHVDAVDYVCVLMLSDVTDMQGGELQVLEVVDGNARAGVVDTSTIWPPDKVRTIAYPGPGYCIFMQGSLIKHGVTPVIAAREPRVTLVNSYSPLDVFAPDRTEPYTYNTDDHDVTGVEYARHKARRCRGQLQYAESAVGTEAPEALASVLQSASEELREAAQKVRGREDAVRALQARL
jgi:hypothetical protein